MSVNQQHSHDFYFLNFSFCGGVYCVRDGTATAGFMFFGSMLHAAQGLRCCRVGRRSGSTGGRLWISVNCNAVLVARCGSLVLLFGTFVGLAVPKDLSGVELNPSALSARASRP